jgi:hypothetical protein
MADWVLKMEAINTPVTTLYHTEEDSNLLCRRENSKPHKESLAAGPVAWPFRHKKGLSKCGLLTHIEGLKVVSPILYGLTLKE